MSQRLNARIEHSSESSRHFALIIKRALPASSLQDVVIDPIANMLQSERFYSRNGAKRAKREN